MSEREQALAEYYAARQADLLARRGAAAPPPHLVPFPFPRPNRPLRGDVFRLRPGHWWWEVIDGTPENVVTVGFANTQAEALRLCLLALRIESGPRR